MRQVFVESGCRGTVFGFATPLAASGRLRRIRRISVHRVWRTRGYTCDGRPVVAEVDRMTLQFAVAERRAPEHPALLPAGMPIEAIDPPAPLHAEVLIFEDDEGAHGVAFFRAFAGVELGIPPRQQPAREEVQTEACHPDGDPPESWRLFLFGAASVAIPVASAVATPVSFARGGFGCCGLGGNHDSEDRDQQNDPEQDQLEHDPRHTLDQGDRAEDQNEDPEHSRPRNPKRLFSRNAKQHSIA